MKTLILLTWGVVLGMGWGYREAAAGTITGTNADLTATIFSDDGFEDDTVGTLPNAPTIGLPYVFGGGVMGVSVENTQAYDGVNSLYIRRVAGGAQDQAFAKFDTPYISGGEQLAFSFAFRAEAGGPGADITLTNGGNPIAQIYYNPATSLWRLYDILNNGPLDSVALESANDTWKEVTITYDTNLFKLTVGAASHTYTGPINGNALDRIAFLTAGGGPLGYYVDAIATVPEPQSMVLLGFGSIVGGLMLWRRRQIA